MIPQRTLSGECEITTGAFSITKRPPVYTGESAALNVQVSFKFQGVDYVLPSGVVAEMYLRYPNTDLMTVAVEMEKSGNTASGVLSAEQTGVAGYPLLVIQLIDMETSSLIVACATAVKVSDVRGDLVIDSRAPSPSEIIYIGRSPYINPSNGHWMQWDVSTNAYVDTDVIARGLPATFTAHATTLPEGSDATASIGGTIFNPIINVGIPKGDTGAKGDTGSAAGFGTPTASVDANIGTPSVSVTATGPDTAKKFNFEFKNLKGATGKKGATGEKGDTGAAAGFDTPTASIDANVGTPSVTVTATGPDTAKKFNFQFHNLKGEDGIIGYTPNISIGTVKSVPTSESAEVTRTGTDRNPVLNFKLPRSGDGVGIYPVSIPIPVAEWVNSSGVYKYTLSDATIKAYMTVLESWLDDEAVQLGKVWYTVNNGSLVVNTDVVPTAAWALHVTLGTDGTDVLEDVADLESRFPVSIANGGTGGTTAAAARQALGITGANIPTSAVSGQTNVDGALGSLSDEINTLETTETLGIAKITMVASSIRGSDIGSKNNKTVNLIFTTTDISTSVNYGEVIATLSDDIKPLKTFFTPAYNADNGAILGSLYIFQSGAIAYYGTNRLNNNRIMCACSYLI